MFYITGDTHGDFVRISLFCYMKETTKEDVLSSVLKSLASFVSLSYYNTYKYVCQLMLVLCARTYILR